MLHNLELLPATDNRQIVEERTLIPKSCTRCRPAAQEKKRLAHQPKRLSLNRLLDLGSNQGPADHHLRRRHLGLIRGGPRIRKPPGCRNEKM